MGVVDTLVTRFAADTGDYQRGAREVVGSTREVDMATKGAGLSMMHLVDAAKMAAQAYALLNGAIIAAGVASYRKFAEFDALQKSLQAVEGNAQNAAKAMKMLRDVAKLPGLGLVEAAEGYRGLRLQGLDAAQSERVIRATGNANALAGGGREELSRILLAIRQILSRPNLSGEELNQLAEGGIPAHRILLDAFGTADGGELKKLGVDSREALEAIVQGLEKMPKAGESAKNVIENLAQAAELAVIAIGAGVATGGLPGAIGSLTAAFEQLDESGGFELIGQAIAGVMDSLNPFRDSAQGLSDVIIQVAGYTYGLINVIGDFNESLRNMGDFIVNNPIMRFLGTLPGPFQGMSNAVNMWRSLFTNSVGVYANDFATMMQAGRGFAESQTGGGGGIASLLSEGTGAVRDLFKQAAGLGSDAERAAANPALGYLRGIERNTREALDIQRMILGGGNIGASGVTAVELDAMRRAPRGSGGNPGFAQWKGVGMPGLARR